MSIQKVNIEAIAAAAAAINAANSRINSKFDSARSAGVAMDQAWNSRAGDVARDLMNQLFSSGDSRSAVLQNYANTLQQVVAPGYDASESQNTRLADLFL